MPSQDFRDIVAIKTTAQRQVEVLRDEIQTARAERGEAMELYELERDLNEKILKDNKQLRIERNLWRTVALVAAGAHLFR